MQGYLVQFVVYATAMVGFFTLCLIVYKKLCVKSFSHTNPEFLCIENGMRINARKHIYVVKAGNERFLIASDLERTTMLAKLEDEEVTASQSVAPIALKKASSVKKHLGEINREFSFGELEEVPAMRRISQKMKA